jgi:hypothetical protein
MHNLAEKVNERQTKMEQGCAYLNLPQRKLNTPIKTRLLSKV